MKYGLGEATHPFWEFLRTANTSGDVVGDLERALSTHKRTRQHV
jgi:hypothetical protein